MDDWMVQFPIYGGNALQCFILQKLIYEFMKPCARTCLEDGNVRYCVLQTSFHVDPNNTLRPDASVAQRSRQRICGVIQLLVGHLAIICTDNCNLSRKIGVLAKYPKLETMAILTSEALLCEKKSRNKILLQFCIYLL